MFSIFSKIVINYNRSGMQVMPLSFFLFLFLFFSLSFLRQEDPPRPFLLHPCLRSSDEEVRFLQKCSQILVCCLLPSKDVQSVSLRIVLAEILATKGR